MKKSFNENSVVGGNVLNPDAFYSASLCMSFSVLVGVFLWNRARVTEVVCECITVVWKYTCLDTLVFSIVSHVHDSNFCKCIYYDSKHWDSGYSVLMWHAEFVWLLSHSLLEHLLA